MLNMYAASVFFPRFAVCGKPAGCFRAVCAGGAGEDCVVRRTHLSVSVQV